MVTEYIKENNKIGKYAGDIELSAFVKLYPYKLYVFCKGFKNLNIIHIYQNENNNNILCDNNIFLLYNNEIEHYNLLKPNMQETNLNLKEFAKYIEEKINININYRKKLNRMEYPIYTKSSPNTYNEIFEYLLNKKLPERISNSSNISLYKSRFLNGINDHYILENKRLKYKKNAKVRKF